MEVTNNNRRWSEEKISSAVLIVLVTLSAVIFVMFFSVGYDEPWEENTEFINPQYTDSVLNLMFFMGGAACIVAIASSLWFSRCHGSVLNIGGKIPARLISLSVLTILIGTLIITYTTSSDSAILINGKSYNEVSWLCISDMLIHTSEVLLFIALLAILYGMSGINRRIQNK